MLRVKAALVLALVLALTVYVYWLILEPAVPWLIGGLVLISIYSFIFRRKW